jgi:hypothetical protein
MKKFKKNMNEKKKKKKLFVLYVISNLRLKTWLDFFINLNLK